MNEGGLLFYKHVTSIRARVLCLDELGYTYLDKSDADLLFQIRLRSRNLKLFLKHYLANLPAPLATHTCILPGPAHCAQGLPFDGALQRLLTQGKCHCI